MHALLNIEHSIKSVQRAYIKDLTDMHVDQPLTRKHVRMKEESEQSANLGESST